MNYDVNTDDFDSADYIEYFEKYFGGDIYYYDDVDEDDEF